MLGEFAREFALLLLVFVPLDVLFKDKREPYFWIGIAVTLVILLHFTHWRSMDREATPRMNPAEQEVRRWTF